MHPYSRIITIAKVFAAYRLDIFQKLRASGFTAVSIYFFWSFHSSSPDVPIDLETGARDIQRLFDYAKEAGIWVITRSGPYVNAETAAGGVALWSTTGAFGTPRTDDSAYHDAWLPWITAVGEVFARNGVDKGGPAILNQHENEFDEDVHQADNPAVIYMEQITAAFDAAGVTVPSSHNEKGWNSITPMAHVLILGEFL
jgi:beta-galactosidase